MVTTVIGIDLGKRWFHVIGKDACGHVTQRSKFNRTQLIEFMAQHPRCLVGMETCCGSQSFARKFVAAGHDVKLLPAQYVKPFVKSQKNDFNDALAIAEAVVLPTMRFVPIRSEEQMDVHALHRARERMLQQRLALTNQIRGLLLDRGVEIAQGFYALRTVLPRLLADDQGELTPMMRDLGRSMLEMWQHTEHAIDELNGRIKQLANPVTFAGAFNRSPASARCWRRRSSLPSATQPTSSTRAISQLGPAWSRGRYRPVARRA